MTDTGPEPDSTDTPEPDNGDKPGPIITSPEPERDPFEEEAVDEELVDVEVEDPGDDAGVGGV